MQLFYFFIAYIQFTSTITISTIDFHVFAKGRYTNFSFYSKKNTRFHKNLIKITGFKHTFPTGLLKSMSSKCSVAFSQPHIDYFPNTPSMEDGSTMLTI